MFSKKKINHQQQGKHFAEFLDAQLKIFGLNVKERADFITFWLHLVQGKEFVLMRFIKKVFELELFEAYFMYLWLSFSFSFAKGNTERNCSSSY